MTRNVMIATPCYGGQVTEHYLQSIIDTYNWAYKNDVALGIYTMTGESFIPRARNNMVMSFVNELGGAFEDLFFIDADQGWDAELNFGRVLNSDYDIACGVYPKKKIEWELIDRCFQDKPGDIPNAAINGFKYASSVIDPKQLTHDGFSLTENGATGFMRIRRHVIEKMIAMYPELEYGVDPDNEPGKRAYALFDPMIRDDLYLGEDYAFCRRWQDMGGEIYTDLTGPVIRHVGTNIYGQVPS